MRSTPAVECAGSRDGTPAMALRCARLAPSHSKMNDRPQRHRDVANSGRALLRVLGALAVLGAAAWTDAGVRAQEVTLYRGMCDASAAVALDERHFVVASDEDNALRIFARGQSLPVTTLPLSPFLGTDRESDLEGAARVGQRIYWISSHGRNSSGKVRPDRYRLFVTEVDDATSPPTLKPVATAHTHLLQGLIDAESLKAWRLADAARLAPEAPGGLNIEGLAETADAQLLIGFRNPVRDGKALVVALRNPQDVVKGAAATFGPPIALELGGRGVRSLERIGSDYLVVAGPTADRGDFALFRWSGHVVDAPRRISDIALGTLRPEALFAWPRTGVVQILSDDGGVETGGVACKGRPVSEQAFRSIEFKP